MINIDEITARNPTRHYPNWPHIPDDQDANNQWLWIRKNQHITKFNISSTRH